MQDMGQLWLRAEVKELETKVKRTTNLPPYLVLDCDALLYHCALVKQLVNSRKFIVLIPSVGKYICLIVFFIYLTLTVNIVLKVYIYVLEKIYYYFFVNTPVLRILWFPFNVLLIYIMWLGFDAAGKKLVFIQSLSHLKIIETSKWYPCYLW